MKRSALFTVLGILFLLAACFCGVKLWRAFYAPPVTETALAPSASPVSTVEPTSPPTPVTVDQTAVPAEETAAPPEETPEPEEPYVSPIDFDTLRSYNSDILGWLVIDDTNIDYPIVQSPDNDAYYLTHNTDGAYSANGSIFSESKYNTNDFSDPVTILYGHHMQSGAMFGKLQQYYTDSVFFDGDRRIRVYTPNELLEYGVFAAVPYSSDHILYYNDFSDDQSFAAFFDSIFRIRDLSARFNKEYAPAPGDRVLILSTCLIGNNTRRFLVMATLLD